MKKRINIIAGVIVAFLSTFFLASCGKQSDQYADYAKVIYHLEEGSYKGSKLDVVMYYPVEEGKELQITNSLDKIGTITPPGERLELEGWYKTKTNDAYSDKITVDDKGIVTDTIKYKETLDLYAKWKLTSNNKFIYKAKIGSEEIVLATDPNVLPNSNLNLSQVIEDEIEAVLKEHNLTYIKEFEFDGNKYTKANISTIKMDEESDKDIEKVIYVDYIEGKYYRVENATDLSKAALSISDYDGIYLMADINAGTKNYMTSFNNLKSKKEFIGNGHTITYSNGNQTKFTDVDGETYNTVSIFNEANNLNIHDVNFVVESTYSYRKGTVLFAGLAITAKNSTFKNINVSYTYKTPTVKLGPNDNIYDESSLDNVEIENLSITYQSK